jgi:phosphoribosylamine--glycine ligase
VMTPEMTARVESEIILPSVRRMAERGTPFTGVLFAGIMVTAKGPKLIEYNVRFGDPECQVLMLRLKSDVVDLLEGTARGTLATAKPQFNDEVALTVVLAAKGYPVNPEKGSEIKGVDGLDEPDLVVFHAGTMLRDGKLIANGGRVLNVTALGKTVAEARDRAYAAVDRIDWPEGFCRSDIGWRAVERELKPA